MYCFRTSTPIFIPKPIIPFELETTPKDYSFIGLPVGVERHYVWERLYFVLSMAGLKINSLPLNNWRIEGNLLTFITENNKKITKSFDKVVYFDKELKEYKAYDWFNVLSGKKHEVSVLHGDSKFVKKLLFHTPRDPRSYKGGKNVVSISYFNETEVDNFEYAPGIARLKTLEMMKDAGIRGRANGFIDRKKGTRRYYALKIEHYYREIKPKINSLHSIDKILSMKQDKGRTWKISKSLFQQQQDST